MPKLTVAFLCADWCHVCTGFAPVFARLREGRPGDRLEWVDIEDEAEALGALEVEDFPTVAVFAGGELLHLGAVRAEEAAVIRLLSALEAKPGAGGEDALDREQLLARLRALAER